MDENENKIKKSIIGVVTDPGVGFCIVDVLLFWQTGGVGLAAMMLAAAIAAGFKTLSIVNPKFIQKNNVLIQLNQYFLL